MSKVVQFPNQKQRADAFTQRKFAWLDDVASDRAVSSEAFRVAYVLASKFLNRRRGYAFPTQEQLAAELCISDRQVRTHIGKLIDAGYIARKKGGNGRANEYRIIMQTGSLASGNQKQTGSFVLSDRKFERHQTGSLASYQPSDQPIENPLIGRPAAGQPSDECSTLDGSRGSRLEDAPPDQSDEPGRETFRVGEWRRNSRGEDYVVLGVDEDARTVTVRFKNGREGTVQAPPGAALIQTDDDDYGDEVPF